MAQPSPALASFVVEPRWTDCEAALTRLSQRHSYVGQLKQIVHKPLQATSDQAANCETYFQTSKSGTLQVALLASPMELRNVSGDLDQIEITVDDGLLFVDRTGTDDLPNGQVALLATRPAIVYIAAYNAPKLDIEEIAVEFHRVLVDSAPSIMSCDGSRTTAGEIETLTTGGIEAWALTFQWPIEANEEAKLVWRVTGSGSATFLAVGPSGQSTSPVWGPDVHDESNWQRPGDEWGTGWLLDEVGCWTLRVRRGAEIALFDLNVI